MLLSGKSASSMRTTIHVKAAAAAALTVITKSSMTASHLFFILKRSGSNLPPVLNVSPGLLPSRDLQGLASQRGALTSDLLPRLNANQSHSYIKSSCHLNSESGTVE